MLRFFGPSSDGNSASAVNCAVVCPGAPYCKIALGPYVKEYPLRPSEAVPRSDKVPLTTISELISFGPPPLKYKLLNVVIDAGILDVSERENLTVP